jgi:hypothetical protein
VAGDDVYQDAHTNEAPSSCAFGYHEVLRCRVGLMLCLTSQPVHQARVMWRPTRSSKQGDPVGLDGGWFGPHASSSREYIDVVRQSLQCCCTCTHSGMDPCYGLPRPPYFNSHGFAFLLTVECSTVIWDMVLISALAREPGRGLMRVPRGPANVFQSQTALPLLVICERDRIHHPASRQSRRTFFIWHA